MNTVILILNKAKVKWNTMEEPFESKPNLLRKSLELSDETDSLALTSEGIVPDWLIGTLIRNGPAKFEAGSKEIYHWFDGLAMLHAFTFQNGQITYSNRFLRSKPFHTVFDENRIDFEGFASDPCRSIFRRLFTQFFQMKKKSIMQMLMWQNFSINMWH
jgi:carotenoid cleavage dioxygenase-like enzyme